MNTSNGGIRMRRKQALPVFYSFIFSFIPTSPVFYYFIFLFFYSSLSSCRQDDDVISPTIMETGMAIDTEVKGLYVLCEGNMGSNKATLDYLDLTTGQYLKNIFPSRNPNQVMQLGDVGNDAQIYGSSLWLVINCSNKVEVCDAQTAVSRGHVDIPNCRFVCFDRGYAYVSSYVGGGLREWDRLGSVYKVDTASLQVVGRVDVGYQPDELCIVGRRLYVANSGGYKGGMGRGYDSTVSIVDLDSFTTIGTIDVAPNLFRIRADRYGQLWVASRGIEEDDTWPSRLYVVNGEQVVDSIDVPVSDMALLGDSLCYMGSTTDDNWLSHPHFGLIDVRTHRVVNPQLLKPSPDYELETPYGLMVHPVTGHIYVMDATNYVSSGWLFCFDRNGNFRWRTSTGDIPGHGCWKK